jgi:hypothetical protein
MRLTMIQPRSENQPSCSWKDKSLDLQIHPLLANGRCKKTMDESKKLIEEEVNWTPNAKISFILLNASKSFLAKHLFNDSNDDSCEVLKGHQFKEIQNKFIILSLPNVCNLVSFKHHSGGGYIDNILELNFIRIVMISSKNVISHAKYLVRRSFFSRCLLAGLERSWGCCTNVAWRQSKELLDHLWPCEVNC